MYSQVSDREKVTQIKETNTQTQETNNALFWMEQSDNVHEHSSYEFKFF